MMLYILSFSPKYMLSVFSNHLHPQLSMSLPPHQLISWNSPISSILFLSQIWPYHHSQFSLLDCELFEGRYLPCFIYLNTVLNECLVNIEQRKAVSQTNRDSEYLLEYDGGFSTLVAVELYEEAYEQYRGSIIDISEREIKYPLSSFNVVGIK